MPSRWILFSRRRPVMKVFLFISLAHSSCLSLFVRPSLLSFRLAVFAADRRFWLSVLFEAISLSAFRFLFMFVFNVCFFAICCVMS